MSQEEKIGLWFSAQKQKLFFQAVEVVAEVAEVAEEDHVEDHEEDHDAEEEEEDDDMPALLSKEEEWLAKFNEVEAYMATI